MPGLALRLPGHTPEGCPPPSPLGWRLQACAGCAWWPLSPAPISGTCLRTACSCTAFPLPHGTSGSIPPKAVPWSPQASPAPGECTGSPARYTCSHFCTSPETVIPPNPDWTHHFPAATVLPSHLLFARPSPRCFWSILRPALWSADCSSDCPVSVFLDSLSLTIPPPFLIVTVPCASLIIADSSFLALTSVSVKSLCIKKPAARSRPGNGVKTIMVCKKRERSRAAGTAQHPVEPAPSLVQRTRAKSGSDKDLSHSQWRSG